MANALQFQEEIIVSGLLVLSVGLISWLVGYLVSHLRYRAATIPGSSSRTASNLSRAEAYSCTARSSVSASSALRHMARPQFT